MGTQEVKRSRKAVPPALKTQTPLGCLGGVVLYLAVCAAIFEGTRWAGTFLFALPAALLLAGKAAWYLYGLALLAIVRRRWAPRGVRCLVVYSNSPAWQDHVHLRWLPRIGAVATVLNLSEQPSSESTLAVRLFRRFCGARRNFNPAVVVFRGLREPYVFRFFYAFQEVKADRHHYLQTLEAQMFNALGVDDAA
jgi:hypothetical protein